MPKTILFAALLLLSATAFGQTTFHKKFSNGVSMLDYHPLSNGNALACGDFYHWNNEKALIAELDQWGEVVWQRYYTSFWYIKSVVKTTDGILILGDSATSQVGQDPRYSIVCRLRNDGTIIWSKILGKNNAHSIPQNIIALPDGCLISGTTRDFDSSRFSSFVCKLDTNGQTVWSKHYITTHPNSNTQFSLKHIEGDTLYATGLIQGNGCFVRIDAHTGELLGWASIGGAYHENFNSLEPTSDGNFLLGGSTRTTTGSEEDRPWVVKVDRWGKLIWSKTYNIPNTNLQCFLKSAENGRFMMSIGHSQGLDTYLSVLSCIDESGNLLWANNYANGVQIGIIGITRSFDGGYVTSMGNSLLKTDADGRVANGCCPAPVAFQVEDFAPPIQNPELQAFDWLTTKPLQIEAETDTVFKVTDFCQTPITTIVRQTFVCQNDSIEINGAFYQAPYTVRDTVLSLSGGCDTVRVNNLIPLPLPLQVESVAICAGGSVLIDGQTYTQADTIRKILPSATDCDTFSVTFVRVKPWPQKYEYTTFCPGESVVVDGVPYYFPTILPNPDTLPGIGADCDTLLYQALSYPSETTSLSTSCPPNATVFTSPGTTAQVDYALPSGTSDCSCPDVSAYLLQGLPSGAEFPVGTTQVCYHMEDVCGAFSQCCFEVKVEEVAACDLKETPCLRYELLDISADSEQNKTYRVRVSNTCASPLAYTLFQLPNGIEAVSPQQNSPFVSYEGREYAVRNPQLSPFRSLRFKPVSNGIALGASDIFEYTLPAQASPTFIRVLSRLASGATHESMLNTFGCVVNANRHTERSETASALPTLQVFPNPSAGEIFVQTTGWSGQTLQWRLRNAHGQLLLQTALSAGSEAQRFPLPAQLPDGLYFLEAHAEQGQKQVAKFVLRQ